MSEHLMFPPKDRLQQWEDDWINERENIDVLLISAYSAGAKAGADAELEACCEILEGRVSGWYAELLRDARRPKPPSLKEKALNSLKKLDNHYICPGSSKWIADIQQALLSLPDND